MALLLIELNKKGKLGASEGGRSLMESFSETLATLLGPDYFDEAKCYGRLFEFCQVTLCHSRQWGRMTLASF